MNALHLPIQHTVAAEGRKSFEKELQIIWLHTRGFICPAWTVNCTPEQDETEQQS